MNAHALELVKTFRFSASHEKDGRVWGHNYVLSVAVSKADARSEEKLVRVVRERVVDRVHSRDLSLHVDFLKGLEITDELLLTRFWALLGDRLAPLGVLWMSLDRDDRTRVVLRIRADEAAGS